MNIKKALFCALACTVEVTALAQNPIINSQFTADPTARRLNAPWEKGAFETHQYRNLFVEMGYKPAEVDKKLQEVFHDVFYDRVIE